MGGTCTRHAPPAEGQPVVLLGSRFAEAEAKSLEKRSGRRSGRTLNAVGRSPVAGSQSPRNGGGSTRSAASASNEPAVEDVSAKRRPRKMVTETRELIRRSMKQDRLCGLLQDEEANIVLETMEHYEFNAGDIVVQQGQVGHTFFVVEEGSLSVDVNGKIANKLDAGCSFGGLALLYSCPRTATVRADAFTRCWGARGDTFQKVLQENAQSRYKDNRAFLDSIPLFDGLENKLKDTIAHGVVVEVFEKGDRVATAGEAAAAIYFAKKGHLLVCEGGKVTESGQIVGGKCRQLLSGESVGGREVLRGESYAATIVADGKCELLSITAHYLHEVMGDDLQGCLERALMISAIRKSSSLSKLSPMQQDEIIDSVEIQSFKFGEKIQEKCRFALVLEGTLKQTGSEQEGANTILQRGEWFDEEGDLAGAMRHGFDEDNLERVSKNAEVVVGQVSIVDMENSYFVVGTKGCRLAFLTECAFHQAMVRAAGLPEGQEEGTAEDVSRKIMLIRKVRALRNLSHEQTQMVARAFVSETLKSGTFVVRQGEVGTCLYVLAKGELRVTIDKKTIRTLGRNACFGERALLFDEPRSASIVVTSHTAEIWSLEKKVFTEIVKGQMQQLLVERIKLQDTNVNLKDLEHIKLIGAGACGSVRLVEHRHTRTRYALKRVHKQDGKVPEEVKRETELLAENDHPFIQTYVKTMETNDSIYILTEVVTGGELHAAIRTIPTVLSRSQAQFYTGSLLLVLEELAGRNIVYRDLKPENVMLDAQGYLKLIDFGIAKKLRDGHFRTFTVVGTPHYMAPEILQGRGYALEVDIWSLGVLLFEFVCGYLPFADELDDANEVWQAVIKQPLKFPSRFRDSSAKDLIASLLTKKPSERLGSGVNGYEDIKQHEYFWATKTSEKIMKEDPTSKGPISPTRGRQLKPAYSRDFARTGSLRDFPKEPPLFEKIVGRELEAPVVPKGEQYTPSKDLAHIELDDAHQLYDPRKGSKSRLRVK